MRKDEESGYGSKEIVVTSTLYNFCLINFSVSVVVLGRIKVGRY